MPSAPRGTYLGTRRRHRSIPRRPSGTGTPPPGEPRGTPRTEGPAFASRAHLGAATDATDATGRSARPAGQGLPRLPNLLDPPAILRLHHPASPHVIRRWNHADLLVTSSR